MGRELAYSRAIAQSYNRKRNQPGQLMPENFIGTVEAPGTAEIVDDVVERFIRDHERSCERRSSRA